MTTIIDDTHTHVHVKYIVNVHYWILLDMNTMEHYRALLDIIGYYWILLYLHSFSSGLVMRYLLVN